MKNIINIKIEYLIRGSNKWKTLNLTPEEYFDLEYNEDTDFDVDSLPKYDDVFQFLNIENYEIKDFQKFNVGKYSGMNTETRKELVKYFESHNKELFRFLNQKFDWDK